ncbi:MAG: hypothetical protein AW07_04441 [Candidatus Accumulibacter sp. SK-11]|nr:MAG: hypothetical protein AW07_04441 [Candidatus Accumulibacter sp. SK-11]
MQLLFRQWLVVATIHGSTGGDVLECLRSIIRALLQPLQHAGMDFGVIWNLALLARAGSPDGAASFVVPILQAVRRKSRNQLLGKEPQAGIEVVDLLHHPFERDVREAAVFVATADVGMGAGKPELPDPLALGPQRRNKVGALLVYGQRLTPVLDARVQLTVAELQEAEFFAVDQTQAVEQRHAKFADGVPDADHADRCFVVVFPEAGATLLAAIVLVDQPDPLRLIGGVAVAGLACRDQASVSDELTEAAGSPGATRETEQPDLVAALVYL